MTEQQQEAILYHGNRGNDSVERNVAMSAEKRPYGIYEKSTYKNSRAIRLMLSDLDILCAGNDRFRLVNKKLIAKCKNQRALVVAHKRLSSLSRRPDTIRQKAEELTVRVIELQRYQSRSIVCRSGL